jgi:hypothetical protein
LEELSRADLLIFWLKFIQLWFYTIN